MEKKRSLGITVFALIEMSLGIIGSVLFLQSINWMVMKSFLPIKTNIDKVFNIGVNFEMLFLGLLYSAMTFPFIIILLSSIYTLKLRSWARKLNFIALPPLIIIVSTFAYMGFPLFGAIVRWKSFLITIIPLAVLTAAKIWYFTRPKVREQFTK